MLADFAKVPNTHTFDKGQVEPLNAHSFWNKRVHQHAVDCCSGAVLIAIF